MYILNQADIYFRPVIAFGTPYCHDVHDTTRHQRE